MIETRIGWIADNFFPDVQRGAEIEDYILIQEAERRGHQVVRMGKLDKDVDFYVLANFVDTFNVGELLGYLSQKPYIHIEHDLRGPQYPYYNQIASEAVINVYHSPLQRELILKFAGQTFKHFFHPMCLPEQFKDLGWKRFPPNEILYVGDYSMEKGYQQMKEWIEQRPECKIWHYGGGFPKIHSQMREMGTVSQKRLAETYNIFTSLIFLPHYIQACSRVIAEAYLCKVPNIVCNGKDGFTSYGFGEKDYDRVRDLLVNGHIKFWDKIEKELGIK